MIITIKTIKKNFLYNEGELLRAFLYILNKKNLYRALTFNKIAEFTLTHTQLIPTRFQSLLSSED